MLKCGFGVYTPLFIVLDQLPATPRFLLVLRFYLAYEPPVGAKILVSATQILHCAAPPPILNSSGFELEEVGAWAAIP